MIIYLNSNGVDFHVETLPETVRIVLTGTKNSLEDLQTAEKAVEAIMGEEKQVIETSQDFYGRFYSILERV